ncbi:MAG: hypothetical protein H8F28_07100 [Fibrella sp.]|nr:hypothetical protein [Armatimonadota bacterium]
MSQKQRMNVSPKKGACLAAILLAGQQVFLPLMPGFTPDTAYAQTGNTGRPAGGAAAIKFPQKNNQTILRVQAYAPMPGVKGGAQVIVNGEAVTPDGSDWMDISTYARPGTNTLHITPLGRGATVSVSHAATAGQFRRLTQVSFRGDDVAKGGRNVVFRLPGTGGVTPVKTPVSGSVDQQYILRTEVSGAPVAVFLNGAKIGDFQNVQNLDVSDSVVSGKNTLRVVWTQTGVRGLVRVAYAQTKNRFRELATVRIQNKKTEKAGEETITFTAGASRM